MGERGGLPLEGRGWLATLLWRPPSQFSSVILTKVRTQSHGVRRS